VSKSVVGTKPSSNDSEHDENDEDTDEEEVDTSSSSVTEIAGGAAGW
jgi:hypothetical protein